MLDVNLMGVWRTDRAVLPQITERKGYLLNIASLAAVSHAPMMGPYATAKAGVEALSNCLRQELALTGARVGCAYFGFIDTDLVRAGFEEPSAQVMRKEMPSFLTRTAPLSKAVDAIENGVERRAARVWAPRFVGPPLAAARHPPAAHRAPGDEEQRTCRRRCGWPIPSRAAASATTRCLVPRRRARDSAVVLPEGPAHLVDRQPRGQAGQQLHPRRLR